MIRKGFIILLGLLTGVSVWAQQERKYIREGNHQYQKKEYNKADIQYRKALEKNDNSFEAKFNIGDALYKQKKYKEAARQFENITSLARNKKELAKVYHNIGNAYLQADSLEGSIAAYKMALRNNPEDMDTKYNLSYALKMLKKQQQKKKQNKKNKKDQKKNQKQNKNQKQDKNKQNQNKKKQQQKKKQKQKQQQQKKKQQQKQQMSKKDAARLLKALQQNENKLQEKLKKQKAQKVKVEKDW